MIKVLFVCLGNICRSPMAQFVLQDMVDKLRLTNQFEIDSAATDDYEERRHGGIHYGTREILTTHNIPFKEHYSRQIRQKDYTHFDYIIAMDNSNIEDIEFLVGPDTDHKVHLLLSYTDHPRNIKDPWYTHNFDETYEDIMEGCKAFLKSLGF